MADNTKYIPINCSFYDLLESYATVQEQVRIVFENADGYSLTVIDQIKNIETKNGEEYIIMKSGQKFRLDAINSINDINYDQFPFRKSY